MYAEERQQAIAVRRAPGSALGAEIAEDYSVTTETVVATSRYSRRRGSSGVSTEASSPPRR